MSLLTSRVTVNDNNGASGVIFSYVLIERPPWFYCAERLSSVISLPSHDFCYVDVVTQEHPRVSKHSDMGLITCTHSCVLGISVPSNAAQ